MPNIQQFIGYCCGFAYVKGNELAQATKDERRADIRQQGLNREQAPDQFSALLRATLAQPTKANPPVQQFPTTLQALLGNMAEPLKNMARLLQSLWKQSPRPMPEQATDNPFMKPSGRLQTLLAAMVKAFSKATKTDETTDADQADTQHLELLIRQELMDGKLGQIAQASGASLGGGQAG
jgi:hypothetical protein